MGNKQSRAVVNTDNIAKNYECSETHTAPLAGLVYLRRPVGRSTKREGQLTPTNANSGPETQQHAPEDTDSATPLLGGPKTPESRQAVTREVARLLWSWLEAFDGRRPISALRRGPFSPAALEELRALIRETIEERQGTPSRLLRVHLPPSHHQRLAFTASAAVNGQVRAIAGHLARYNSRWRVESVTLLHAS